MKLAEMSSPAFEKYTREKDTVIVPVGAVEVYGPHLPLGSDSIVGEEVAWRVADRLGLVVTPTLYVGESHALYEYPGTMVIKPEHFRGYLEDMCKSLIKWGIRRFCFINPHLGNVPIIAQMSRDLMDAHDVRMCQIDWWRIIQPICAKEQITVHNDVMAHGHASEAGTSCLLYLRPDLVDMSLAACVPPLKKDAFPDIQYYNKTFRTCKTETGTLGDATLGTREKGERIVNATIDRIVSFLETEFLR